VNMVWDGLFHAVVSLVTLVGVFLLWSAVYQQERIPFLREFVGRLIFGWGWFNGCDRSIPQALCRQLPMLSAFGHVHVSDGHWFCRQVPLVDLIPPLTQPEHPQVQEDLAALDRPRHPRALEALRADKLARGFRDARAQW
jgi:hypothetical protein